MRRLLKVALTGFIWATAAVAQDPVVVQSVGIVDYGIYRIELSGRRVSVPSAAGGEVRPASHAVLIAQTNQIPAKVGTTFGYQLVVNGSPTSALADFEVVVEHPAFTLPDGKVTGTTDRVPWKYWIGRQSSYTYTFDHDWEAVPGRWSIEIWRNGKRLVGKEFVVGATGK